MPADQPQTQTSIRDFPGLMLQADTHELRDGTAANQINMMSTTPGQMELRTGFRPVSFEV